MMCTRRQLIDALKSDMALKEIRDMYKVTTQFCRGAALVLGVDVRKYNGRPKTLSVAKVKAAKAAGKNNRELAEIFGVCRSTIVRTLKPLDSVETFIPDEPDLDIGIENVPEPKPKMDPNLLNKAVERYALDVEGPMEF